MSAHENLSPDQFPTITGSRREYGTATVKTEDHPVQDNKRTLMVQEYNWHDGDAQPHYVEARGPVLKKNGEPGKAHGYTITKPPPHVLDEFTRLRES